MIPIATALQTSAQKILGAAGVMKSASDGGSGTSGSSGTSSTSGTADTGSSAAASTTGIGDRFLTLLVTQLKNQDPLNPMDNAQLTTQLAQISTVTGINKLNDTMSALSAALGANQYLQAAGLVGHSVIVPGSKIVLDADAEGAMAGVGALNLANDADHVTVTIKDQAGLIVRTLDLGGLHAGLQAFSWDGANDAGTTAGAGIYTFGVQATSGATAVSVDTLMTGHVDGVFAGTNGGSTQVQLGRLGRVDSSAIQEIL